MSTWQIIPLCVIVATVAAVIAIIRTRQRTIRKVAYMMDAMEDSGSSQEISTLRSLASVSIFLEVSVLFRSLVRT